MCILAYLSTIDLCFVGTLNTEIMVVYITCTCIVTLAISICMIWFRYHVKQRHEAIAILSQSSHLRAGKEIEDVVISNGIYDYIDEANIRPMKNLNSNEYVVKEKHKSNESSDSNDTNTLLGDGYLNPYQPIVSIQDFHKYCGKEITQCSPTENIHDDHMKCEDNKGQET